MFVNVRSYYHQAKIAIFNVLFAELRTFNSIKLKITSILPEFP